MVQRQGKWKCWKFNKTRLRIAVVNESEHVVRRMRSERLNQGSKEVSIVFRPGNGSPWNQQRFFFRRNWRGNFREHIRIFFRLNSFDRTTVIDSYTHWIRNIWEILKSCSVCRDFHSRALLTSSKLSKMYTKFGGGRKWRISSRKQFPILTVEIYRHYSIVPCWKMRKILSEIIQFFTTQKNGIWKANAHSRHMSKSFEEHYILFSGSGRIKREKLFFFLFKQWKLNCWCHVMYDVSRWMKNGKTRKFHFLFLITQSSLGNMKAKVGVNKNKRTENSTSGYFHMFTYFHLNS